MIDLLVHMMANLMVDLMVQLMVTLMVDLKVHLVVHLMVSLILCCSSCLFTLNREPDDIWNSKNNQEDLKLGWTRVPFWRLGIQKKIVKYK